MFTLETFEGFLHFTLRGGFSTVWQPYIGRLYQFNSCNYLLVATTKFYTFVSQHMHALTKWSITSLNLAKNEHDSLIRQFSQIWRWLEEGDHICQIMLKKTFSKLEDIFGDEHMHLFNLTGIRGVKLQQIFKRFWNDSLSRNRDRKILPLANNDGHILNI